MSLMETTTMRQPPHHLLAPLSVPIPPSSNALRIPANMIQRKEIWKGRALIQCCSDSATASTSSPSSLPPENAPPVLRRRKRYRRQYPGESKGITEEMRFVAMRLRKADKSSNDDDDQDSFSEDDKEEEGNDDVGGGGGGGGVTWQPIMDGFLKYLVDSKLVFNTVERIVDESSHVAYAYFRKTGLERSEGLGKDLEWLSQQGFAIPDPGSPGVSYAKYLEELAENSAPLFLCHFYNIYFAHVAGGQVIARQASEKLLEGRELEFYRWEGDVPELMKDVREKLNMLGEHWIRDEKNKCLKEATKSFRFLGQIVRLIIL
ncbi:probable inactive heme oxygenase 2, chloroplastic [Alnus glutinosa]|uniref:probable inactive heme oxygenase 2, chloroplastic n=1 Tax=Alnus glutinosa TaxID=3517 RepID=UPI002D770631|nr:probable inactive heme oxygenase 2, chloroplastic [Alnus glutinosa]XP_062174125.1 probable inactive heme oxygenase 2, chloroplastic [Alnus glutinosa]XP_062174126.1 probable inactive heme oxygenase 2, chloroplastic [Alnus glutinosa]XP_062174127.1 probable inactive heme oxygenase 2, chloroplastic [Alnus glutinosa]